MEKHIPTLEEIRRDIDVELIAKHNDGTQTLFADILDRCRDRYCMPKLTFWDAAKILSLEYNTTHNTNI